MNYVQISLGHTGVHLRYRVTSISFQSKEKGDKGLRGVPKLEKLEEMA